MLRACELRTICVFILALIVVDCNLDVNADVPCSPKDFGDTSVVCVCNATYCDTISRIKKIPAGQYLVFTTSKDGKRFHKRQLPLARDDGTEKHEDYLSSYTIDPNETYQTLIGFGGALTDSAAINMAGLSSGSRENLIRSYFSENGIEYNMLRLTIAACDFSSRAYTYDDSDVDDLNLASFELASEDVQLKIPMLKQILKASSRSLALFASAWTAPLWMKTNGAFVGNGTLKGQPGSPLYSTWAKYIIKFLDEYAKRGIAFWGLTGQNEPTAGLTGSPLVNMVFTAQLQRDFIAKDLGPALARAGYGDIKLMILDDQRMMLPQWAETVLTVTNNGTSTIDANQYVAGIAFHWYLNYAVPAEVLTDTHKKFPDKFLISTEASAGAWPWEKHEVILGNWERGENYAQDIIEDLLHWTAGWVDWNIALDMKGGPNWMNITVDSPVIVDKNEDSFYKQPMYYALGHFSKFLDPGSVLRKVSGLYNDVDIAYVAFDGPERKTVFVVLNKSEIPKPMTIRDQEGNVIKTEVPQRSIQTYVWSKSGDKKRPNRRTRL